MILSRMDCQGMGALVKIRLGEGGGGKCQWIKLKFGYHNIGWVG